MKTAYITMWSGDKSLWWSCTLKRWTEKPRGRFSSHRDHRNAKAAWKEFFQIRDEGFTSIKMILVKGKRFVETWSWERKSNGRRNRLQPR